MMAKTEKNESDIRTAQLPFYYRLSVSVFEVIMVILLAVFCSEIFLNYMIIDEGDDLLMDIPPISTSNMPQGKKEQFTYLKTVDAFYGAANSDISTVVNNVPESTLDIKIFGLRAKGNGNGTAILKSQGSVQRLARVGDEIASGATLTAIFANRIEFRRNGRLETIYLEKEEAGSVFKKMQENPTKAQANKSIITRQKKIAEFVNAMDLSPFREGKEITGFTVGINAEESLLSLVGIEVGDIISVVNGNRLHSWERVKEISEEATADSLDIQFERRGEPLTLTLSQSSLGL